MITIDRASLAAATSVAARIAARETWTDCRLACADGLLTVTASDGANHADISAPCEGAMETIGVNASKFHDVINLLPADTVTIEAKDSRLHVLGGRGKRQLATTVAEFPEPEFHVEREIIIPGAKLREALDFTVPHIADPQDHSRRGLSGVHLLATKGELRAIGTDASEIAVIGICPTKEEFGVTVNSKVAEFVGKLAPDSDVTLRMSTRQTEFAWDGGLIRGPVLEDPYPVPQLEHHLAREYGRSANLQADELLRALQSIRALGALDSVSRSRRVKMALNGSGVISTQSGEGSAEQEFPADWPGELFEIGFASARMDRILRHFGDDVLSVGLADATTPMRIEAAARPDRLCLLFPLRF